LTAERHRRAGGRPGPGSEVGPASAELHHDSCAHTMRTPASVTWVPHPSGPVSAWMMSSPWGRSSGFRWRHGPPRSSTSIRAAPGD